MKRHTIEEVAKIAENKNITLLSSSYLTRKHPLNFYCKKHGIFNTSLASFLQSKLGCPKCSREHTASLQRMSLSQVQDFFTKCGYKPLFTLYETAKQKLSCLCELHGEFKISYDNLKQGKRCRKCASNKILKFTKLKETDFNNLINELSKKNITPLFTYKEYVGLKEEAEFTCSIHGHFISKLDTLKYAQGCRKCTTHHSSIQSEIAAFVLELTPKIIENSRNLIKPLEIDIYSPHHNIGIEFCGLWWHSEKYKNKKQHKNKLDIANKKGIRLITIFEDEWVNKTTQVKGYLRSVFSQNNRRIYARNTVLKKISPEEAKIFLKNTHILGSSNFIISFGLYIKEELIGIVTGGKHHRNSSKRELVLNRLAFKNDITVVGGASKLLKALTEYAKQNGYTKIISWSDNRWSEGNVYEKLGFRLAEELPPDYSYVKKELRIPKQSLTKKRLTKLNAIGNTEREMALSLGYHRIWDCGKKRWEMYVS